MGIKQNCLFATVDGGMSFTQVCTSRCCYITIFPLLCFWEVPGSRYCSVAPSFFVIYDSWIIQRFRVVPWKLRNRTTTVVPFPVIANATRTRWNCPWARVWYPLEPLYSQPWCSRSKPQLPRLHHRNADSITVCTLLTTLHYWVLTW